MDIIFDSVFSQSRPVRLSESTRRLAQEYLTGEHGSRLAASGTCVTLDDIADFERLSAYDRYDAAIRRIAEAAPLCLDERELLAGSASLLDSSDAGVPARYKGCNLFPVHSHLTSGFDAALVQGLDSYQLRIERQLPLARTDRQRRFLQSLSATLISFRIWHGRLVDRLDALRRQTGSPRWESLYLQTKDVPFSPPGNFREALQSLWLTFTFLRLTGNWPGIGRIDAMLEPYLRQDLKAGSITEDEARELIAHFLIKGSEWVTLRSTYGGDSQHYQNLVLAGLDRDGNEVAGTVTRLILEVLEELPVSDFPVAVRVNGRTPAWLFRLIGRVTRHGGGIIGVYNESMIEKSLLHYGYPPEEARNFANDGCWEIQIPGKTNFAYYPFDALSLLNRLLFEIPEPKDYGQLYAAFRRALERETAAVCDLLQRNVEIERDKLCSPISLLTEGCIENMASYFDYGAKYTLRCPHLGGIPDAANSLYALKRLVFEEKKVTYAQMLHILATDWEDCEELRRYVRSAYLYYGNDNDEPDMIAAQIAGDFAKAVRGQHPRGRLMFAAGISTFGRQLEWLPARGSSAFGVKKGEILANNYSPTPGTDSAGATAVIRSYCKTDFSELTNGAALELRLDPTVIAGEKGLSVIEQLIRGFVALGGCFLQLDVQNPEVLKDAQLHPERHQNLSVRVSGWSARFITLDPEWQRMMIERSSQHSL